jgi:hypothetical protein
MRLPFVLFSIKAFVLMRAGLLCCFAWEDVRGLAGEGEVVLELGGEVGQTLRLGSEGGLAYGRPVGRGV